MGVILEHLVKDHGVTLEQAKLALKDWQINDLVVNGRVVGECMLKNNEVHIALNDASKKVLGRRALIREGLSTAIEGKDFLVTRLFHGDRYRKLIEFIGFKHTHSDAKFDYFWLDRETMKCWQ